VGKVCPFLKSESLVNQSYAAACLEKLLIRKSADGSPLFTPASIDQNTLLVLLGNICEVLQQNQNLYAIRVLFRVIQLTGNQVENLAEQLGQVLATFILSAAKDDAQTSPNYTYILFEIVALALKNMK